MPYVNFNKNQTEKLQCQGKPGYDFNDGGTQSVRKEFVNGFCKLETFNLSLRIVNRT